MKYLSATRCDSGTTKYFSILHVRETCSLKLDDFKCRAQKNDVIFSREALSFSSSKHDSIVFYSFEKNFFDSLFDSQTSDCRILYDFLKADHAEKEHLYFSNIGEDALNILLLLQREFTRDDIYHEKIIKLLVVGLFSYLDRNHGTTLIIPNSTMLQEHQFGKILKYIGDHYREISLESTAKFFSYHPDYLSYYFKKVTGESFSHKLLSIRMEQAQHLLLSTEFTIQEIANLVGYHDRSHFSRNFHTFTGCTPKQFRKMYIQKKND